ncbi:MAG: tRNA pseudouridine(55) synthase TruB [Angelakisella sp.]
MQSGIICVDKPKDFTSFDVVAKARGITGCRKMGHGGTLDPMATGVLPLFLGRATKVMDIMPGEDKRYTASFRLGLTTDTQDITGTVLEESSMAITPAALENALLPLRGEISQLPPMYSAVQVGGRRLYDLARAGKEIDRPCRTVSIYTLELVSYDEATRQGVLDIACSKGTYVRTIIHDIGTALGCGGVLTALRRTETLGYKLD